MKTLISFAIYLLATITVTFAQQAAPMVIPGTIKQSLMRDFPGADPAHWRVDPDGYWARFDINGIKQAVKYNKEGKWTEKEMKLETIDIPEEITSSISKNFDGYNYYEAEKVELPNKRVTYFVDLQRDGEYIEVHFSSNGKVLGQDSKTERSDWENDGDM